MKQKMLLMAINKMMIIEKNKIRVAKLTLMQRVSCNISGNKE